MLRVVRQIERLAPTPATVLLQGESGTGKELLARALHAGSPRRNGRFVAINCGAIPDALLESELFGHERGAFTGAVRTTPGRIELADGGTLFLDEIGDLPLPLQVKLLRFLQERVIERLGGREPIRIDVRVVSATHNDLLARVAQSTFREDLYYRLAEMVIGIPPLRERAGDAALIAHRLAERFADELGTGPLVLADTALEAIAAHRWPGNVRELENAVRRAAILADGGTIGPEELGIAPASEPECFDLRRIRDAAERDAVLRAMGRSDGNIVRAAELLGISRPTLYDLLNRFGLR